MKWVLLSVRNACKSKVNACFHIKSDLIFKGKISSLSLLMFIPYPQNVILATKVFYNKFICDSTTDLTYKMLPATKIFDSARVDKYVAKSYAVACHIVGETKQTDRL